MIVCVCVCVCVCVFVCVCARARARVGVTDYLMNYKTYLSEVTGGQNLGAYGERFFLDKCRSSIEKATSFLLRLHICPPFSSFASNFPRNTALSFSSNAITSMLISTGNYMKRFVSRKR